MNTGAVDPVGEICELAHGYGAWVHVDGAFGMWAAASPRLRHLVAGVEYADSWATDAHKWLNVPYDSGLVSAPTLRPIERRWAYGPATSCTVRVVSVTRSTTTPSTPGVLAASRSTPRSGRWAGVALPRWSSAAARLAQRFAEQLAAADGVEVLNEVVLNQVLVRLPAPDGDDGGHTDRVLERLQHDGTCWMSGTRWHGEAAVRISVSNWSTTADDVDRSVAALLRAHTAG